MDRLDLNELEQEAARPCPLFWTGPRPGTSVDRIGPMSELAQAVLNNESLRLSQSRKMRQRHGKRYKRKPATRG